MAPSGTLLRPRTSSLHLLAVLALCALRPGETALAASPTDGTITPTGPALIWTGTALGTGSANEATCVEGVTCDTFTLTVGGAPADYAGKAIAVKIQWSVSANDYDLYIHKDSNSGLLVGVSADGAPQNGEASAIDWTIWSSTDRPSSSASPSTSLILPASSSAVIWAILPGLPPVE